MVNSVARKARVAGGTFGVRENNSTRYCKVALFSIFLAFCTSSGKLPAVTGVEDLLKPEFKGKVALNGNPTQASAAFHGVMMAAIANGGSADNIAPGVDFFAKLQKAGNFLPVDPTPATIASGQTPVVIDWEYLNVAQSQSLKGKLDWKLVVPEGGVVGSFYIQAINKDAPHPAAARLWQEFLYSDEAQIIRWFVPPQNVAIVTGAARGIGLAIAQKFLSENHQVALLDVDAETLRKTAETLNDSANVLPVECDVACTARWGVAPDGITDIAIGPAVVRGSTVVAGDLDVIDTIDLHVVVRLGAHTHGHGACTVGDSDLHHTRTVDVPRAGW